jgi:Domain of unknown function (DUF4258)
MIVPASRAGGGARDQARAGSSSRGVLRPRRAQPSEAATGLARSQTGAASPLEFERPRRPPGASPRPGQRAPRVATVPWGVVGRGRARMSCVDLRFFLDPVTGEPHIYRHGVSEEEVEEVLGNPGEERSGRGSSRVVIGATEAGRVLRVIYAADPQPGSGFVITA